MCFLSTALRWGLDWRCISAKLSLCWIGKKVGSRRTAVKSVGVQIDFIAIMPRIGGWPSDSSNLVASQFASKNYFLGELSGARHILGQGQYIVVVSGLISHT